MQDIPLRTRRTRRHFLKTGVGLGLAGTLRMAHADDSESWEFEQFHLAPEHASWRVLDAHDSGHVTPGWSNRNSRLSRRITFDPAPDGRNGFCHVVRSGDIVRPLGVDSARIPADFGKFSRVLLRYHHWVQEHSYRDGKWIGLQLGRGWVGRGYVQDAGEGFGSDGGSATTMHPGRDGGNGVRLLGTHTRQKSSFGELVGRGTEVLPKGRWLTVDVVIDKDSGHRLYVDSVPMAENASHTPVEDWDDCDAIWYRIRLMHGGDPAKLPALNNYREWFGGFFIAVA